MESKRQKMLRTTFGREMFHHRYEATVPEMTVARHAVRAFAREHGFGDAKLSDIELAVGEALNNAEEHGAQTHGHVFLSCSFDGNVLVIDISDDGPGFAPERLAEPSHSGGVAARGFGVFIMRRLMDDVTFSQGGRKVTLVKRL